MDPFRDRVAVITGGAGGIGMAMARAFAARGAKLALADLDEAACSARSASSTAAGRRALGVPTDVTRLESVRRWPTRRARASAPRTSSATTPASPPSARSPHASHRDWEFTS